MCVPPAIQGSEDWEDHIQIKAGRSGGMEAKLTKLMVVREAKSIDVSLLRDGKSEVSPTKGILETQFASVAFASDRDALGNKQPL